MKTFSCCRGYAAKTVPCNVSAERGVQAEDAHSDNPEGFYKRAICFIKPLLPAFLLALVPKCPFCLAAYIALGTGIGLSVTSARYLHIFLLCAGVIPLSLFAANHIRAYFFPTPFTGWKPQQQLFTGMMGMLIGSSILWLF